MCRMSMAVFVRILSTIFTLIFMWQKISGLLFKISGSEPLIFSLLLYGCNVVKISFHFFCSKTVVFLCSVYIGFLSEFVIPAVAASVRGLL